MVIQDILGNNMSKAFTSKQLQPLFDLGLNKNQAVIYLTLLQNGIQSVLELSKHIKINRQQIYTEAEKLLNIGLLEVTRKNRRKYIAANPTKVLKLSKEKILKAENIHQKIHEALPLLESIPKRNKSKAKMIYFEGLPKVKEAYERELEECKNTEVLSFAGSVEDIYNFFPESYWNKWNKTFTKQGSSSRMLIHNSEGGKAATAHDTLYSRETRYLEKFALKTNIDVFNNTVLILSYYDETAIWIESKVLADSYRILFESLWGFGKSYK